MRIRILFTALLVFLVGCTPSQEEIQSTVQVAIALTKTAEPITTFTPSPVPTETSSPSPTPGLEQLIDRLNTTIRLMEGSTQIIDVLYVDSTERLILQVDAISTAEEYDERDIVADVFTALYRSYEEGFPFDESLFSLRVVGYDVDLERQGAYISEWMDMIDWFENNISTEQLVLKLIFIP